MKSLRGDFVPVFMVIALVGVLTLLFPREVLNFKPCLPNAVHMAGVCFLRLEPERERDAVRALRASWQNAGISTRQHHFDLRVWTLPETTVDPVLDNLIDGQSPRLPDLPFDISFLPPSRAAEPPRYISAARPVAKPPVFSREELLKMN